MSDTPAFLTGTEILMAENAALQARLAEATASKIHWEQLALEASRGEMLALKEKHELRAQLTETQKQLEVQLAVGDKLESEFKRLGISVSRLEKAGSQLIQEKMEIEAELAALREACRLAVLALAHASEQSPGLYGEAYSKLSDALGR